MNFKERKEYRTKTYFDNVYKHKLVPCTACNGSGYYDNYINSRIPKCACCNGTGKQKEPQ